MLADMGMNVGCSGGMSVLELHIFGVDTDFCLLSVGCMNDCCRLWLSVWDQIFQAQRETEGECAETQNTL